MRTTVDLPLAVRRRAEQLAAERHQSLSAVVAELTVRGLAQLDEPVKVHISERTGLPVISIGRRVTSEEVGDLIDEDQ